MKKIEIEVQQTGTDYFVAQCNIKAKVNGKYVKASIKSILLNAIELAYGVKIDVYNSSHNLIRIRLTVKNGNTIIFDINGGSVVSGIDLELKQTVQTKEIDKYMQYVVSKIKEMEEWIHEVHKITKNTLLKYN